MTTLIYIHGFLSSPYSFKAQQTQAWLAQYRPDITYVCPHLNPYPKQTQLTLEALVESASSEPVVVMGSSLGGYWATWLAEKYHLRAVLINPSVRPWDFMPNYLEVDLKSYHTDDSYRLQKHHVTEIQSFNVLVQQPNNYWLLVQTGDETLDYTQAVAKYRASKQTIEMGGNHGFEGFERYLPAAIEFLIKE